MVPRVCFAIISASSRPLPAGKRFRTPIQPPHLATNSPPPGIPSLRPHHLPSRRHIAAESLIDIPFRLAFNESIISLLFDSFLQLSPQGHSHPTHTAFSHFRQGRQLTCRLCRPDTLLPTTTTNTHPPRGFFLFPSLVNCHQSLRSHLCPPFQAHQLLKHDEGEGLRGQLRSPTTDSRLEFTALGFQHKHATQPIKLIATADLPIWIDRPDHMAQTTPEQATPSHPVWPITFAGQARHLFASSAYIEITSHCTAKDSAWESKFHVTIHLNPYTISE